MICTADPSLRMRTVRTVWFWLFIVAILLLIAYAIAYETTGTVNAKGVKVYPWWVWGLLGVAVIFLFIAFIFMIVGLVREKNRLKAACTLAESQQFRDAAACGTPAGHVQHAMQQQQQQQQQQAIQHAMQQQQAAQQIMQRETSALISAGIFTPTPAMIQAKPLSPCALSQGGAVNLAGGQSNLSSLRYE